MTPTVLTDVLSDAITEITADSAVFGGSIHIFKNDIPLSADYEGEEDKYFPCAIVRPVSGEIKDVNDAQTVQVSVYICAYDTNPDMQGYTDTMQLCEKLIQRFSERGNVGDQFRLLYPVKWILHEDTYPYYCCELILKLQTYTVRGDIEQYI